MARDIGIHLLLPLGSTHRGGDPAGLVDLATRAEDAGADGVVVAEHIVMGSDVSAYPWGSFPLRPDDPFPEPIVLLSAIASSTTRLRLSTGILIAALRPPALLAKQLATVDVLSNGRLDVGVGTGWHADELEAHGLDFTKRGQLLTDTLAACRTLWGPQPATVSTPSFSFGPVYCLPRPMREGGPPVLYSGTLTPRNVRRITENGDGWIPIMSQTLDEVARGVDLLRRSLSDADRDPDQLRVRVPLALARVEGALSLSATLSQMSALPEGVTDVTVPVAAFVRSEDDIDTFFTELASRRP